MMNWRTRCNFLNSGIIVTITGLLLTACASQWQAVKGPTKTVHCAIQMPQGWMRTSTPAFEMATRDGPYLQYILIQEQPVENGFQHTRRKLNGDMLAHELAEVVVDNIQSDPAIRQFTLNVSEPAMVGGRDGFMLNFSYLNEYAVEMQTLYYGVIVGSAFVSLRFNAAQRHYYETGLPAFEAVLESLRFSDN